MIIIRYRMFRCTRTELYSGNCPGRKHLSARQGHYVRAISVSDALAQMYVKFPCERLFTATLWN